MKVCQTCGKENIDEVTFCTKCGMKLDVNVLDAAIVTPAPIPSTKKKRMSRKKTIMVASIIVIAMVLTFVVLAYVPILSEKVVITVVSDHSVYSVDYKVYIDEELKASGTLQAGSSKVISITLNYAIIEEGNTVVVTATSMGGGFGDETDQAYIALTNGVTEPVTLYI